MLRSNLLLAIGSAGLVALVACGDDGGTGGSGGSGGSGAGAPTEGVQPPPRPEGAGPGDSSAATIFGTTKLYLGVKTREGVESTDAWKDFGYDLDGQVTTNDFANHCTPAGQGIPTNVFPDGNNGIDNSFGRTLLPVVKLAAMGTDLEAEVNSAIAEGSFNVMINIRDLGTGANYDPLDAILLAGKNGSGNTWEIVPEILNNPADPGSSKVTFPESYLSDNVWVSGNRGTVDLTLSIAGFDLSLEIKSAFITMELSADRTTATKGVIAGVLDTEALVDTIANLAGSLSPDFCDPSSPTVASILNQVRQASDIMADGSQQAGTPCTGISIGLGFDAAAVTVSGVGMPAEPTPDPCDTAAGGAGGGN